MAKFSVAFQHYGDLDERFLLWTTFDRRWFSTCCVLQNFLMSGEVARYSATAGIETFLRESHSETDINYKPDGLGYIFENA